MDPAGKVPLLRELENMGAWFCRFIFALEPNPVQFINEKMLKKA